MPTLIAVLIDALAFGSVYALVAVGFSVVLRASRVAQFGAGYAALIGASVFPTISEHVPMWVSAIATALIGAVVGAGFYVLVLVVGQRLGASDVALSLACLAGGLVAGALIDWAHNGGFFSSSPLVGGYFSMGSEVVQYNEIAAAVVGGAVLVAVYLVISRTMLGKAMTAAAKAPDVADVSGVQVRRVVAVAWILAGVLFAVAGALLTVLTPVSSTTAFPLAIKGFAGSVVGGVDNPAGAAAGALLFSVLDIAFIRYVNASYDDLFIFSLLFVLVAVRPGGLRRGPKARLA